MGRCGTGLYLRRAGRHCDAGRTTRVPLLPALLCRYVLALGGEAWNGTSVRAVDRLSGGRRYLGMASALVVSRSSALRTDQPGAAARCRRRGTQLANSRTRHATEPWRWMWVSTCVRCDPLRQALLAGDAGATGGLPGALSGYCLYLLVHCHQQAKGPLELTPC